MTDETPEHQYLFDALLDKYNDGTEPLESWETADIVRLGRAADAELQERYDRDRSADATTEAAAPNVLQFVR